MLQYAREVLTFMKKWLMAVLAVFVLTACGDKKELNAEETAEVIEEGTIGFEIMGDNIEEATNVPEDEKEQILAAFDEYITAFNEKDIERYTKTLSRNPEGFDFEEDIQFVKDKFSKYNIERKVSDVTIVKYSKEQAQVYANLTTNMTELATDVALASSGRQVTVFVKENGAWKVTSIYYIGNDAQ